jgi:GDP-D-mannose 3',5'-epimerase
MRKALILGAGFIGYHLADLLKSKGYFVRAVDIESTYSRTNADEFLQLDLRDIEATRKAFHGHKFDEVYQLAADFGGMGFIHNFELECLTNNVQININCLSVAAKLKVPRYFYSSSVCVYPDMEVGASALSEEQAYPANPDNEYGWEKLYSERVALSYAKHTSMKVRIARFQNCFGELGTYQGGREKAPAAICRKVALATDGDQIEVWGDGTAVRNFIYVKDLVRAIYALTHSNIETPANIGTEEYITVNELVNLVAKIAGKKVKVKHIDGPVGVQSRNFKHDKIRSLGWKPEYRIVDGLVETYNWIERQVINDTTILDNKLFKDGGIKTR